MKYFKNVAGSYDSIIYSIPPCTNTNMSVVSRRPKLAWWGKEGYAHTYQY